MRAIIFDPRHLNTQEQLKKDDYPNNSIQTSKYTLFSFIPKNLYEQFRRIANSFFLLLIILQVIPEYKVVDISVVATPLLIVVLATAVKDAIEDFTRHSQDKTVNRRKTHRLVDFSEHHNRHSLNDNSINGDPMSPPVSPVSPVSPSSPLLAHYDDLELGWEQVNWENVKVGDLILLKNDEPVPADMIIVSSSEPEGVCYVETMNLDGETNLKLRQSISHTRELKSPHDFMEMKCEILCEDPNESLSSFQSTVELTPVSVGFTRSRLGHCKTFVDFQGIMLRGTVVRNTQWVTGIVFATGQDTKQIKNSGDTPSKQSELDKLMNTHIAFNLVLMVLICLSCSIGFALWTGKYKDSIFVGGTTTFSSWFDAFVAFWGGLILYQNIVPISLYICIELAKSFQSYLIHQDLEMYHEKNDTPCSVRTWNIGDNLGQIEYIFSDKTGTLTRNIMEFKHCSIGEELYMGEEMKEDGSIISQLESLRHSPLQKVDSCWLDQGHSANKMANIGSKNIPRGWFDPKLDAILAEPARMLSDTQGTRVHHFMTLLSLCHSVVIDKNASKENENKVKYCAQSPDEMCLVAMAAENGYVFQERKLESTGQTIIMTKINDNNRNYVLMNTLEFDSSRKRMSVIVKCLSTGRIFLYCKGADNVIMQRLDSVHAKQDKLVKSTWKYLEKFAEEGLRTLCLAYREIDKNDYEKWNSDYDRLKKTIFKDSNKRAEALNLINDVIEKNLLLLGCTAIEDKLQEGVPECIEQLMKAGIKFWILTGDKMETAINVGYLCGLLNCHDEDKILQSSRDTLNSNHAMAITCIKDCVDAFDLRDILENMKRDFYRTMTFSGNHTSRREHAIVIDGTSLETALSYNDLTILFLDMACRCKTVICCRVSPLQKAKVVEVVIEHKKSLALAIGDGANDVSMIQSAHVGVGISGEEGLQAAMSADYAIAQFRFLKRLLLVHGRWSYSRNSYMILNFYLKSLVFSLVVFWFQFFCGFSAAVIYEFTYMLFYNQVFTVAPIMILAFFDRDLESKVIIDNPQIYRVEGINRSLYTHKKFFVYTLESIWYSLVCYFVPVFAVWDVSPWSNGRLAGLYYLGTIMATSAILAANISPAFDTHSWVIWHHLFYWISCSLFFVYVALYNLRPESPVYNVVADIYMEPVFWLSIGLSVLLCLAPRFVYHAIKREFRPSDRQILEEIQKYGDSRWYRRHRLPNESTATLFADEHGYYSDGDEDSHSANTPLFGSPISRKTK